MSAPMNPHELLFLKIYNNNTLHVKCVYLTSCN